MKVHKTIKYLILLTSFSVNAEIYVDPDLQNDFKKNSTSVTSVSEVLANKKSKESNRVNQKYDLLLDKYCQAEQEIFCSGNNDKFSCLKSNFDLMTGNCYKVLQSELQTGMTKNKMSIHDLKLPKTTKYFGSKDRVFYKDSQYKSEEVFDYRGLRFRKGFITARSYAYKDYKGQYVISSGYPKSIFVDNAGIEYNPHWQKGPFFFDENGNVSIGSLSKTYEYKQHIYLKKGSMVVFNKERELIKGIVAKSVRIGNCGFLPSMEISDKKIKTCKE